MTKEQWRMEGLNQFYDYLMDMQRNTSNLLSIIDDIKEILVDIPGNDGEYAVLYLKTQCARRKDILKYMDMEMTKNEEQVWKNLICRIENENDMIDKEES